MVVQGVWRFVPCIPNDKGQSNAFGARDKVPIGIIRTETKNCMALPEGNAMQRNGWS